MRTLLIAVGLALIAPAAFGQQSPVAGELAYCERLYDMHGRYVARIQRNGSVMRDGMADLAVDRCRTGRFADGIPVLEAKLAQAKIPLPER